MYKNVKLSDGSKFVISNVRDVEDIIREKLGTEMTEVLQEVIREDAENLRKVLRVWYYEIEKKWILVIRKLEWEEEFDLELWKECITRTYYFFYDSIQKEMVDKRELNIIFRMYELKMATTYVSAESVAAQMVTGALIDTIMRDWIVCIDDELPKKGEFVVEGETKEMLLYKINVDNIDLDEIIKGEMLE